jgi:predicted AAA+ superfamily ATPase
MVTDYRRPMFETALARVRGPRKLIEVLAGPRQVGKTTLARQVLDDAGLPSHYATADDPVGRDTAWIETQWELGRVQSEGSRSGALLVLDEVQKVTGWSEVVKRLWDEDTADRRALKVFLLGSAPLLGQGGLTESLAGRFELIRLTHWSLEEMRQAFGWGINRFLYFGGYPGAADLAEDEQRWRDYILDSLVETTISRDILLLSRVDKPALLRQVFRLACSYSGQILSYNKMLGQLQDAGNTTTLAHYLELLAGAGMVTGLQKYSGAEVRRRASSPKLVVMNTALMTATSGLTYTEAKRDTEFWGRLVESAVGAHLLNAQLETFYWRDGNLEVDYLARRGKTVVGFEVASGRRKGSVPGLAEFSRRHRPRRTLLVGAQGIPVADFLREPGERWLRS